MAQTASEAEARATRNGDVTADMNFSTHAEAVIREVQASFAAVLDRLPEPPRTPTELQRTLGIDKTLAWKVVKFVEQPDPFAAVRHLPGTGGVKILLRAAGKQNVPSAVLNRVDDAIKGFGELTAVHAGDRASLDLMLEAHARDPDDQVELKHRASAFRGMSYVWGVQAMAQFKAHFWAPSESAPGMADVASLRGLVGLRRIRPNVNWIFGEAGLRDREQVVQKKVIREPLVKDLSEELASVSLIPQFCSKPLPSFRRCLNTSGEIEDELIGGEVGDTAAVTCVSGEFTPGVGPLRISPDAPLRYGSMGVRVYTPCETLIFDQVFHKDVLGELEMPGKVYSELRSTVPYPGVKDSEYMELPVRADVMELGRGHRAMRCREIPKYAEMGAFVFETLGWNPNDFQVFRTRIEYPPIPVTVAIRHQLPEE